MTISKFHELTLYDSDYTNSSSYTVSFVRVCAVVFCVFVFIHKK